MEKYFLQKSKKKKKLQILRQHKKDECGESQTQKTFEAKVVFFLLSLSYDFLSFFVQDSNISSLPFSLTPVLSTILWLTFQKYWSHTQFTNHYSGFPNHSKTLLRKIDGPISVKFLIHSSSSSLFFLRVLLIQVRRQTFPKVIPEVQPVHPTSGKCLWSSYCGVWSVHIPTCQSGTNTYWYYSRLPSKKTFDELQIFVFIL